MTTELLANIDVDDLNKAVEFYSAGLGLRPARRFANVVEILGASARIYLLEKAAGSSPSAGTAQRRDYRRHWTSVHLDFVVTDIHAAVERAQAAGARLEGVTQTHPWGHTASMSDPFGNGFCLIEFIGRGYDEIATNL